MTDNTGNTPTPETPIPADVAEALGLPAPTAPLTPTAEGGWTPPTLAEQVAALTEQRDLLQLKLQRGQAERDDLTSTITTLRSRVQRLQEESFESFLEQVYERKDIGEVVAELDLDEVKERLADFLSTAIDDEENWALPERDFTVTLEYAVTVRTTITARSLEAARGEAEDLSPCFEVTDKDGNDYEVDADQRGDADVEAD